MIVRANFIAKIAIVAAGLSSLLSGNAYAARDDLFGVRATTSLSRHMVSGADLFLAGLSRQLGDEIVGRMADISGLWPALQQPVTPVVTPNVDFNVFGSVVVPVGQLPLAQNWKRVSNTIALCDRSCQPLGKRLTEVASDASVLPTLEALRLINRTINNAISYRTDKALWGKSDYWATAAEIIAKRAGDCEDFAIAKMALLREAGFDKSQLQLIVLKDVRKQVFHAVLAVHTNGTTYILDNMNSTVTTDVALRDYMPIMSFAGEKGYVHGFKNLRPEFASLGKSDLANAMPGEAF